MLYGGYKFFYNHKRLTYLQKFGKHWELCFGYLDVTLGLHKIVDEFGICFHQLVLRKLKIKSTL